MSIACTNKARFTGTIFSLLITAALLAAGSMELHAQVDSSAGGRPALSVTYDLTKPFKDLAMRRYSRPDTLHFTLASGVPEREVAERSVEIRRGERSLSIPAGDRSQLNAVLPYDWGWVSNAPSDTIPFTAQLVVRTRDGRELRSDAVSIPVRVLDSKFERRVYAEGYTVSRYQLCLFRFDRAELGDLNERILRELVYPDIGEGAEIEVIGHMDIIGMAEHNMRLSENRARNVVTALRRNLKAGAYKALEGRGVGEGEPIYTNDLPEGRFYNRTTQVIVYSPKERGR